MAALLFFSIAGGIYYWDKSRDLALQKDVIEQHTSSQLVAKDRNINQLNSQLNSQLTASEKEKEALNGRIAELNNSLNQKSAELWEMGAKSTASQKTLRNTMETQLAEVKGQTEQLTSEN
ncbi:hypothetical protein HMI54_011392, partial [Coelomomyces lativittatus]